MRVFAKSVKVAVFAAFAAVMLMFGLVSPVFAAETPSMDNPVIDSAGLFTSEESAQVQNALHEADDKYNLVFVVETITSLDGRDVSITAVERANTLGVGNATTNNGVYMLIAQDDRKVWMTVGGGLQDKISYDAVQNVMDQVVIPQLKNDKYVDGTIQGMNRIGEVYADATKPAPEPIDLTWLGIALLVLLGVGVLAFVMWAAFAIRKRAQEEREYREERELEEQRRREREKREWEERFYDIVRISSMNNPSVNKALKNAKTTAEREELVLDIVHGVSEEFEELIPSFSMDKFEKNYIDMIRNDEIRKGGLWDSSSLRNLNTSEWNQLRSRSFADFQDELKAEVKRIRAREEKVRRERVLADQARRDKEEKQRKEAKNFWAKLTPEQKRNIKSARTNRDKQRIVESYNNTGMDTNIMFPLLAGMYVSEIGRPESSYASSHGSSSSSSSSSSSYDSGSSFSSGSFDGGGGFSSGGGGDF